MFFTFSECTEKYGNRYRFEKALCEGKLFLIEKGVYSDEEHVPELQIIAFKYPDAVFTMESAFYFHGLTDVKPEKYHIATARTAAPVADERVVQVFEHSDILNTGTEQIVYDGASINVYSKERMLVELLRKRSKLAFDYYKKVLGNYRKIFSSLDYLKVEEYACAVPKSAMILRLIQNEVL